MVEKYIFLGFLIIFALRLLISKDTFGNGFYFMGAIIFFGLIGFTMGAHYFSYIMIFLGLIGGIVILSFERMLIEKKISLMDKEDKRQKGRVVSGVLLSFVLCVLVLTFKKNENYFSSNIVKVEGHKDIFEMIKNDYLVSMGLMMILVFLSLISINLITKKEE